MTKTGWRYRQARKGNEPNDYLLGHYRRTLGQAGVYSFRVYEPLSYLGRVSGRDEDKVAGAGRTVEFTGLGNPIYAEADLAIECKKLYGQPFDASLMPAEQRAWYENAG